MDRKEIKRVFRSVAQQHGFKCQTSRYAWIVGNLQVLCSLDNSQWDSGMYIGVLIEPVNGNNKSAVLEDWIVLQYRVVDYDCPYRDMLRALESESETLSVSDASRIADWTMSHIKSQWPSLEVIARKALDEVLQVQIGALVSGGMKRWATAYVASLPKTSCTFDSSPIATPRSAPPR